MWCLADGAETLGCGGRGEVVGVGCSIVDLVLWVLGIIVGFALVMGWGVEVGVWFGQGQCEICERATVNEGLLNLKYSNEYNSTK